MKKSIPNLKPAHTRRAQESKRKGKNKYVKNSFAYGYKKGAVPPRTQQGKVSCVRAGDSVVFSILGVSTVLPIVFPKPCVCSLTVSL